MSMSYLEYRDLILDQIIPCLLRHTYIGKHSKGSIHNAKQYTEDEQSRSIDDGLRKPL